MNTPALETERLILRKFTENDLHAIYKIYSDKEVNKFLPWFPLTTMADAKAFYKKHFENKPPCLSLISTTINETSQPISS